MLGVAVAGVLGVGGGKKGAIDAIGSRRTYVWYDVFWSSSSSSSS